MVPFKERNKESEPTAKNGLIELGSHEAMVDVHATEPGENEQSERLKFKTGETLGWKKCWMSRVVTETRNEAVDMEG